MNLVDREIYIAGKYKPSSWLDKGRRCEKSKIEFPSKLEQMGI